MCITQKEEGEFVSPALTSRSYRVSLANAEKIIGIRFPIAIADSVREEQQIMVYRQERTWFLEMEMNSSAPTKTEIVNNNILTEVTS